MKVQFASLSFLLALGLASAGTKLRRRNEAVNKKTRSRNAQSIFFPAATSSPTDAPTDSPRPSDPNILFLMLDDSSADRFPEYGNEALKGKLPGIQELKEDGAIWYPRFHTAATVCAPSQSSLTAGLEPGNGGFQNHLAGNARGGKIYKAVPEPEVEFFPEFIRKQGYWNVAGGKLDYQVAEVIPTFWNEIDGAPFVNVMTFVEKIWTPAIEMGKPFLGMVNMMDQHEQLTSIYTETPIMLTDSLTGEAPDDLPNGKFGYATNTSINFRMTVGEPPVWAEVFPTDVKNIDITGYNGDFDETTLTHANLGLPGYVAEEIGMQSIWAREYDLIRNIDWKIMKISKRLKDLGIYDNTMMLVFGDHGSGDFKGKVLLQPQSVNSPMWIKYPADMPLSSFVTIGDDGYNTDDRLFPAKNIYPTVVSVMGIEPPSFLEGTAMAGEYEPEGFEDSVGFALVARVSSHYWKSFAAYNKEFFYVQHKLNRESVEARTALAIPAEAAGVKRALTDLLYAGRYSTFGFPAFERMTRLMYINAENKDYDDRLRFLTTDEGSPPAEVLYDLRSDPWGTVNLLVDYTYTPIYGDEMQSWGNFVTEIKADYGEVHTNNLDDDQLDNYNSLKASLEDWVDSLKYVDAEIDWTENLLAEENRMALGFWPDGSAPATDAPVFDITTMELSSTIEGSLIRYSVNTNAEREKCDTIGADFRAAHPVLYVYSIGMDTVPYTSRRNGNSYDGYLYGGDTEYALFVTFFMGFLPGCSIFIKNDGTFMEVVAPSVSPIVFDTRDAAWNDETQTWDNVDPDTGEWIDFDSRITFFDEDAEDWDFDAFQDYVISENRDYIYTGMKDGAKWSGRPYEGTLNREGLPAPKYWAIPDEDLYVTPSFFTEDEFWKLIGWSLEEDSKYYATDDPAGDIQTLAGSYSFNVAGRYFNLGQTGIEMTFDSYDIQCLYWDVGNTVEVDWSTADPDIHIFSQAIRKGYADSMITESVVMPR